MFALPGVVLGMLEKSGGFRVWGLGLRVQVHASGFMVHGLGLRVWGLGFSCKVKVFRLLALGCPQSIDMD